jgi:hypothetical protein
MQFRMKNLLDILSRKRAAALQHLVRRSQCPLGTSDSDMTTTFERPQSTEELRAKESTSLGFTLFACLPTELRIQIWEEYLVSLVDYIGPSIHIYRRKDIWRPLTLTEEHIWFEPDCENLYLEFQHDLVDPVHIKVPLMFVNRESRYIALEWTAKHGIKSFFPTNIEGFGEYEPVIFGRRFDPSRDILYIPFDRWYDLLVEVDDRVWQPDIMGRIFSYMSMVQL